MNNNKVASELVGIAKELLSGCKTIRMASSCSDAKLEKAISNAIYFGCGGDIGGGFVVYVWEGKDEIVNTGDGFRKWMEPDIEVYDYEFVAKPGKIKIRDLIKNFLPEELGRAGCSIEELEKDTKKSLEDLIKSHLPRILIRAEVEIDSKGSSVNSLHGRDADVGLTCKLVGDTIKLVTDYVEFDSAIERIYQNF
jgi:hypothetical protein